jgi:predicted aconitase
VQLTEEEAAWARGESGQAMAMATRILGEMGRILGADRLIPVTSAHIDGCLYHGDSGVHFAERLVAGGGQVKVPTTLNVGALNLLKPEAGLMPPPQREMARRLMHAYVALGCQQTWTCAPYQVGHRPALGEDIAWAESNAVVFANSVLGARTNRYGDFLDICAALTGRAPHYGLHLPENRRAVILVRTDSLSDTMKRSSLFFPVLGAWLGRTVGSEIAVLDGLPADTSEDALKALGAAAASTGAVALFHAVGITPEAPTLEAICHPDSLRLVLDLTPEMVRQALDSLSTTTHGERLDVIALGSPHYSLPEVLRFEAARNGRRFTRPVTICTNRHVLTILERQGKIPEMTAAGVEFLTDTCVVVTPILPPTGGVLMTDSGKFAHYTPPNTGYAVAYGSVSECVESAIAGRIVRFEETWK